MHLWCCLIQQSCTTLNLLRKSRINTWILAEAQLNCAFDYNSTLLSPPGTQVIINEKPDNRGTWVPKGAKGWYIIGALDNYRCWTVYVTKTAAERVGNTIKLFPQQFHLPTLSSKYLSTKATLELAAAFKNHPQHLHLQCQLLRISNPLSNRQTYSENKLKMRHRTS